MTEQHAYSELSGLWVLWYLTWLKHLHNPARYAICWRHMTELEARGA